MSMPARPGSLAGGGLAGAAAASLATAWATGDGSAATGGGAGGSGDASTLTLTASWTSDDALRNSRMLLPSDAPTSGSLPGPRMSSAITRMMTSSRGPGVGSIVVYRSCETRGSLGSAAVRLSVDPPRRLG